MRPDYLHWIFLDGHKTVRVYLDNCHVISTCKDLKGILEKKV